MKENVGQSPLCIDLRLRLHFCLKITFLPKESEKLLPVLSDIFRAVRRLWGIVRRLHQLRIGETPCSWELEYTEVHGRLKNHQDANPIGLRINLQLYLICLPTRLQRS